MPTPAEQIYDSRNSMVLLEVRRNSRTHGNLRQQKFYGSLSDILTAGQNILYLRQQKFYGSLRAKQFLIGPLFIYDSRNSMVLLEKTGGHKERLIYDSRNSMVLLENIQIIKYYVFIYDSRNSMVLLERENVQQGAMNLRQQKFYGSLRGSYTSLTLWLSTIVEILWFSQSAINMAKRYDLRQQKFYGSLRVVIYPIFDIHLRQQKF